MSYLDTAYKLGAAYAIDDFVNQVQADEGNPTASVPTRKTAAELAVEKALEKLGEPKGQKVMPGSRKGGVNKPTTRTPVGKGSRFSALKARLGREKGVKNPGALAAAIGRSKFGKGKFQSMAAKGK